MIGFVPGYVFAAYAVPNVAITSGFAELTIARPVPEPEAVAVNVTPVMLLAAPIGALC